MNCKPGDLAIIIYDPFFNGADVGKMVLVVRVADAWTRLDQPEWECLAVGSRLQAYSEDDDRDVVITNELDICDAWLMPLPKDIDSTTIERETEREGT